MRLRTPEKFNPLIAFDANGQLNDLLKKFHSRKQFSVLGGIAQLGARFMRAATPPSKLNHHIYLGV